MLQVGVLGNMRDLRRIRSARGWAVKNVNRKSEPAAPVIFRKIFLKKFLRELAGTSAVRGLRV